MVPLVLCQRTQHHPPAVSELELLREVKLQGSFWLGQDDVTFEIHHGEVRIGYFVTTYINLSLVTTNQLVREGM